MNGTIKDATVKKYHYDNKDQMRGYRSGFWNVYNDTWRLKTLNVIRFY